MFLTVPETITKGSEITVQLSIPNLQSFSKVANSSYYSNTSNWKSFSVEFCDEANNQKVLGLLEYTGQTGVMNFKFTVTSEYESQNLLFKRFCIYDKANGHISIEKTEVSAGSFDMSF